MVVLGTSRDQIVGRALRGCLRRRRHGLAGCLRSTTGIQTPSKPLTLAPLVSPLRAFSAPRPPSPRNVDLGRLAPVQTTSFKYLCCSKYLASPCTCPGVEHAHFQGAAVTRGPRPWAGVWASGAGGRLGPRVTRAGRGPSGGVATRRRRVASLRRVFTCSARASWAGTSSRVHTCAPCRRRGRASARALAGTLRWGSVRLRV